MACLPPVARLTPNITRILGQNPGPFTLQGTNCYLVASTQTTSAVLIDTGEGVDTFVPLLNEALGQRTVSDIILTHWHHDHVGGLKSVLQFLQDRGQDRPRVHQFQSHQQVDGASSLTDGQEIDMGEMLGDELTLTVLHVPGHTVDSIALHYNNLAGQEAIFSADTVLGQGTAVFEDLSTYMASLNRLAQLTSAEGVPDRVAIFPGHGPVLADGRSAINEYIQHRTMRQKQAYDALASSEDPLSARSLCDSIYGCDLDRSIVPAAIRGVQLILDKLEGEGKIRKTGGERYAVTEVSSSKM